MNNYFLKLGFLVVLAILSNLIYFFTINTSKEIESIAAGDREFILKNAEIVGSNNEENFSYSIFSKKAKTSDLKKLIYLEQLERLRVMKPHLMFPSHGVVLPLPEKTLFNYIEHRQNRHQRVLKSVRSGTTDISGITNFAYSDTPGAHPILAQQQTLSHLLSHERNKLIEKRSDGWFPL